MMPVFLLSLAIIGFWIGWRARYCRIFFSEGYQWIEWLFMPAVTVLVWGAFLVIALLKGWL